MEHEKPSELNIVSLLYFTLLYPHYPKDFSLLIYKFFFFFSFFRDVGKRSWLAEFSFLLSQEE